MNDVKILKYRLIIAEFRHPSIKSFPILFYHLCIYIYIYIDNKISIILFLAPMHLIRFGPLQLRHSFVNHDNHSRHFNLLIVFNYSGDNLQ